MTKVLIVDDSAPTRDFHAHILKDAGFACVTAVDGMDGLEKATSAPFDFILTDINMQGMDGYEFIRRVRTNPEYKEVPIDSWRTTQWSRSDPPTLLCCSRTRLGSILRPCEPLQTGYKHSRQRPYPPFIVERTDASSNPRPKTRRPTRPKGTQVEL